jgi:hypothetical protein
MIKKYLIGSPLVIIAVSRYILKRCPDVGFSGATMAGPEGNVPSGSMLYGAESGFLPHQGSRQHKHSASGMIGRAIAFGNDF